MAAAFARQLAGDRHRVLSAGTSPGPAVHPAVLAVMGERGVDLTGVHPQRLTPGLAAAADVLVTMGCGETCPVVPGARVVDWALEDPKDLPLDRVRAIRDDIERRVRRLIAELDAGPPRRP